MSKIYPKFVQILGKTCQNFGESSNKVWEYFMKDLEKSKIYQNINEMLKKFIEIFKKSNYP